MTLTQKEHILLLRSKGQSYTQISRSTGVSINTVKSLCQREKSRKAESSDKSSTCKQCGAKLIQTPGHRQKTFCCPPCRLKWWRQHPEEVRHRLYTYTCGYCGKTFTSVGSRKRVYCSRECYMKAVSAHE